MGFSQQCWHLGPHRPHRLDAAGGLYEGSGRKPHGRHRGDAELPSSAEEGPGSGGERGQHTGQTLTHRGRILPL